MNELLLSNLKKSIRMLEDPDVKLEIGDGPLMLMPAFKGTRSQIVSPQAGCFGFYALRCAIRGVLLSVNFLGAGESILLTRLYGPTVLLFYTSSYHTVMSYLALQGRAICNRYESYSQELQSGIDCVLAVLSRNNQWKFEPVRRGHTSRWLQLEQVFTPQDFHIPECFHRLFQYYYHDRYKVRTPLKEIVKKLANKEPVSRGQPYEIREVLHEFLSEIAASRHLALYASFGSDPGVYDALVNGDVDSSWGIEYRAREHQRFASAFLSDQVETIRECIDSLNMSEKVREALFLSVCNPPFDMPQVTHLFAPRLRDGTQELIEWLKGQK